MFKEENNKLMTLKKVINQHNLEIKDLDNLLNKRLIDSDSIKYDFDSNNFQYNEIAGLFEPNMEFVDVENIAGLQFNSGTFLDTILSIYKDNSFFDHIGNFDIKKFNKSLEDKTFCLIEKDGKYYVNGDGNHRCLLMLFQYHLELAKDIKRNASKEHIQAIKNKFNIMMPVIHLKHDKKLLETLIDLQQSHKSLKNNAKSFICEYLPNDSGINFSIKQNIDKTYNFYYKGIEKKSVTKKEILDLCKKINEIELDNNFIFDGKKVIIYNDYVGVRNVPFEDIYIEDDNINFLKLKDIGIGYFLEIDNSTNKAFLSFDNKSFDDANKTMISNAKLFLQHHKPLLKNKVNIDNFGYLEQTFFDNITPVEAKKIIEIMKELNNVLTKKNNR